MSVSCCSFALLRSLTSGERFQFVTESGEPMAGVYEYRGQGWYSSLAGYDGGPWHDDGRAEVVVVVA